MRYLCLLSLICWLLLSVCFSEATAKDSPLILIQNTDKSEHFYVRAFPDPKHLAVARSYAGLIIDRSSERKYGTRFLEVVGLDYRQPWCAAFVSYSLDKSNARPTTRSGLARHFLNSESIPASSVIRDNTRLPAGTIVGWARGNSIFGHIGFTINWKGSSGTTIEGNTSAARSGSQFNGGGVWIKDRDIMPTNYFRITWFTLVSYDE